MKTFRQWLEGAIEGDNVCDTCGQPIQPNETDYDWGHTGRDGKKYQFCDACWEDDNFSGHISGSDGYLGKRP